MLVRASAPDGGGGGAISDTHDGISRIRRATWHLPVALPRRYQAFLCTVRVRPPQVYTLKQVPGRSQEWSATLSPAKTTHTLYYVPPLTPNMNI